jgi:hypothetical protein
LSDALRNKTPYFPLLLQYKTLAMEQLLLPFRKYAASSMFADEAKTNGAGANGGEFPRNVLVLDDQFPEVDGRPIES